MIGPSDVPEDPTENAADPTEKAADSAGKRTSEPRDAPADDPRNERTGDRADDRPDGPSTDPPDRHPVDPPEEPGRWRLPAPSDFRLAPTVFSHGAFQCRPFEWDAEGGVLTRVLRLDEAGPRIVRIAERVVEERGGGGTPDDRRESGGRGRAERAPGLPPELRDDPGRLPPEVRERLERRPPEPRVELEIATPGWTADEHARSEIEEAVVFMLGLDRDLEEFHDLCRDDPGLSRIPEIGAGRLLRCPRLWEELVKAICGTNVRWEQAVAMIGAIAELGEAVDGHHAWPRPEQVLEAGEEDLRERARLGYRAPFVVELARRVADGSLDPGPAEAGLLDRDELHELFLSVPGIGEITAAHLLTLYGHPERLSVDAAVVAFLRDRHFGGRTPSEEEIRRRYEPYGRWRALAYWFEFVQEAWWPALGVEL